MAIGVTGFAAGFRESSRAVTTVLIHRRPVLGEGCPNTLNSAINFAVTLCMDEHEPTRQLGEAHPEPSSSGACCRATHTPGSASNLGVPVTMSRPSASGMDPIAAQMMIHFVSPVYGR